MMNDQFSISNVQGGKTAEKKPDRAPFLVLSIPVSLS